MEFIKLYFIAEKTESLIFIGLGIVALSFSFYALWKWQDAFYKGIVIPLILIGVIQIIVGGTVYFRTDQQIEVLNTLYQRQPQKYRSQEIARMDAVMKNFHVYKVIEMAFVIIGLILIISIPSREFWLGFGVGLLLQGALMLTADVFAERRGMIYVEHVRNL